MAFRFIHSLIEKIKEAYNRPYIEAEREREERERKRREEQLDYSPHNGQWKKETSCCRIEATTGGYLYGTKVHKG